jgi:hypothetical protein
MQVKVLCSITHLSASQKQGIKFTFMAPKVHSCQTTSPNVPCTGNQIHQGFQVVGDSSCRGPRRFCIMHKWHHRLWTLKVGGPLCSGPKFWCCQSAYSRAGKHFCWMPMESYVTCLSWLVAICLKLSLAQIPAPVSLISICRKQVRVPYSFQVLGNPVLAMSFTTFLLHLNLLDWEKSCLANSLRSKRHDIIIISNAGLKPYLCCTRRPQNSYAPLAKKLSELHSIRFVSFPLYLDVFFVFHEWNHKW